MGDVDGATAQEVIINNASWSDVGMYDCVVGSACGTVTSAAVALTYPGSCRADFNSSGTLNVQDIFAFLAAWFGGAPGANFNGVGGTNIQDIFDFLAAWFAGC